MNMIIIKPWGSYEVSFDEPNYKVKRIIVNPNSKLSYQSHNLRKETWVIISGKGIFTLNNKRFNVRPEMMLTIDVNDKHRIENNSNTPLVFIEVQIGTCDEDDIIRYEDDYGRI